MGSSMQAVVVTGRGGPEVLELREVPRPEPREGEVLVRVHAAGVNASDRVLRVSPFHTPVLRVLGRPAVAGLELSGVVEQCGPGVTRFAQGDAVYGALPGSFDGGSYAQYVRLQEQWLGHKPANLSFEEAAGLAVGGLTALQMLRDKVRPVAGEHVLIHGASGAVGLVAVQLARAYGCQVTGVCSTDNVELVRSLGAHRVLDYKRDSVGRSGPYDVVFDVVGRLQLPQVVELLRPGGCFVTPIPLPPSFIAMARLRRMGYRAFVAMVRPNGADLESLRGLAEQGTVRVPVDQVLPLREAAAAWHLMEHGHPRGRLVLSVSA